MTDNEIIKALECLTGEPKLCKGCPYDGTEHYPFCREHCAKDALDLINRQKAEIEMFQAGLVEIQKGLVEAKTLLIKDIQKAKSEAIKDFAERLKKKAIHPYLELSVQAVFLEDIDNLVKEMVGDNNEAQ